MSIATDLLVRDWGTAVLRDMLTTGKYHYFREQHPERGEERAVFTFLPTVHRRLSPSRLVSGFSRPLLEHKYKLSLSDLRLRTSTGLQDALHTRHFVYIVNMILTAEDTKAGTVEFCKVHSVLIPESGLFQMHLKLTK